MQFAGKGGAGGRWHPEVRRSGIEDNGERLSWGSDQDRSEILSSHEVGNLNLWPSWVGTGDDDLRDKLLQSLSELIVETSQEVSLQDFLLLGKNLLLELDSLNSCDTDQENS